MQSSSNQDLRVCLFRVSVVLREILPRPHFISKCRTLYRESKLFLFIVLTLDSDDTRYSGRRDREFVITLRNGNSTYPYQICLLHGQRKNNRKNLEILKFKYLVFFRNVGKANYPRLVEEPRCHQSVLLFYRFPRCPITMRDENSLLFPTYFLALRDNRKASLCFVIVSALDPNPIRTTRLNIERV